MKTTRSQASKRLFKKLSALRATLSNEERAILDNLIVVEEVNAHRMVTKSISKAAAKTATKAAQVNAHRMVNKAVSKAAAKTATKAAAKTTFRIAFDPNSEEYKISE